ncbi:hypothetical protein EJB05_03489, partial [Eragrostis curvula]
MMTRARRRRLLLLAESHEPVEPAPVYGPEEWRDWANLIPDLIDDISGRLLSHDVAEYLRFRAACKPWRDLTADPRDAGVLDIRFLNLATAASIGVDLPSLSTHCNLGAADGLLVLADRFTKAVRLLDPLRNAVIEFPSISSIVAAAPPKKPDYISAVFRNPQGVDPLHINGAAIDDSTSPPTLVLCLRSRTRNIVFAKPGDDHWTLVGAGEASVPMHDLSGHVLFYSLLSFGGRCYVSSPEGSVYLVELGTFPPRLVEVVNQRHLLELDLLRTQRIFSLLVSGALGAGTKTKMLMVRFWPVVEDTDGYNQKEGVHGARLRQPHRGHGGGRRREEAASRDEPGPAHGVRRRDPLRAPLHGHIPLHSCRPDMPGLRSTANSAVQHVPYHQEQEGMQEDRTAAQVRATL